MVVAHDHLRVNQDVGREDEGTHDAVAKLDLAVVREECVHEAEQDHHPDRAKQVRHPRREVVLCLASEQAECDEDAKGEDDCFEHNLGIGERDNDGDAVGFHGGESSKEDQVHGIRLALPEGEAEEYKGADYGPKHHPRVALNEAFVCGRDHRDVADRSCSEELDSPIYGQHVRDTRGCGDGWHGCTYKMAYTLRTNAIRMSSVASATTPPNLKSSGRLSYSSRGTPCRSASDGSAAW